jgi:hypothetical protein
MKFHLGLGAEAGARVEAKHRLRPKVCRLHTDSAPKLQNLAVCWRIYWALYLFFKPKFKKYQYINFDLF